ncbi:MAG: hypothetical protein L0Z55_02265 [Planctomycetes bacterium]|nr:hypothetical protein [Planctomycetota bacterium]
MEKKERFLIAVQTALICHYMRPGARPHSAAVTMDRAVKYSELIPDSVSAVQAALEFLDYWLADGEIAPPPWMAGSDEHAVMHE